MKTRTCLVQLILFLVFLGVSAAAVRRFLIRTPDEAAPAKPAQSALTGLFRREPKEAEAQSAEETPGLPAMPEQAGGYIEGLTLQTSRPLMFPVQHPRGLTANDEFYYISAHDPDAQTGIIYQTRRDVHAIAQMRAYAVGGRHQIGGLDLGKERLWAPLAGEGEGATSLILGIDPIILEITHQFEVADRIAAVVEGPSGRLCGSNADGSSLYEWSQDGAELRRVPAISGVIYGDMAAVAGSLVCAGLHQAGGGSLDVVDPGTLSMLARHRAGTRSPSTPVPTAGGFTYRAGLFLFLPAGGEFPKILTYVLDGSQGLDSYVPSVEP